MDLSVIRALDMGAFTQLELSLASRAASLEDARTGFGKATAFPGWGGAAANAASMSFQTTGAGLGADVTRVRAVQGLIRDAREDFGHMQSKLTGLDQRAAALGGVLDDNGSVRFSRPTKVTDQQLAQIQAIQAEAEELIGRADQVDDTAQQVLAQATDPTPEPSGATVPMLAAAAAPSTISLPAPPASNASPADNAAWWSGLTPAQQQDVITNHPDWVGNRDGVSAVARDQANRSLLPQLEQQYASGTPKRADIDAVEQTLSDHPDALLMVLDMSSGKFGHAAVALGNPDTADHIAVADVGMDATVAGELRSTANEAQALKTETSRILDKQGQGNQTVATIAWLGCDTPQVSGQGAIGDIKGAWDVSHDAMAKAGAQSLSSFYEGLAAAWHPAAGDASAAPQITALGHSYGSLTASLALQDTPKGVVQNAVFYGSPGIEASSADQLHLDPGHVFAMREDNDPITIVGGWFDEDPVKQSWIERMSTHDMVTPADGGLEHQAGTGHSEYTASGGNGQLYMPGYNIAAVVAGRPDLVIQGT